MPGKTLEPHWVILFDDHDSLFTVRGPMRDDTDITNRVADLQKTGRAIRCQTVPVSAHPTRNAIIEDVGREFDERLMLDDASFDDV